MKRLPELLYRLRNSSNKNSLHITSPFFLYWLPILELLYKEGYIQNYRVDKPKIFIFLRYYRNSPAVQSIKLFDKPSTSLYLQNNNLWKFSRSNGLLVLSTAMGIKSHKECLKLGLGGRVLFFIA